MSISGMAMSGNKAAHGRSGGTTPAPAPSLTSSIIVSGTALDFTDTDVLWLEEHLTGGRIGYYQHTIFTRHLPGNIDHAFPPSPCRGFVNEWNAILARGGDETPVGRMQFHNVLVHLAEAQCNVTIDITPSSTPGAAPTIDSIAPE